MKREAQLKPQDSFGIYDEKLRDDFFFFLSMHDFIDLY